MEGKSGAALGKVAVNARQHPLTALAVRACSGKAAVPWAAQPRAGVTGAAKSEELVRHQLGKLQLPFPSLCLPDSAIGNPTMQEDR